MLIGFLGIPGSGKTTIASSIFSNFKQNGINTELIVEQARLYIAEKRFNEKLLPNSQVILYDKDQLSILKRQSHVEKCMKHSCGDNTAIISDSSTVNTFLYMSKDLRSVLLQQFVIELSKYDLLFYCHPVENFNLPEDSNRVHSEDSLGFLNTEMQGILKLIKNYNSNILFELAGTLEDRIDLAGHFILEKKLNLIETSPND